MNKADEAEPARSRILAGETGNETHIKKQAGIYTPMSAGRAIKG